MNLIQFNNSNKEFNGEYILKDLNFNIDSNDKIGLIGLNGAGKTTLVKMILGGSDENNNIYVNPNIKIGYLSQNHSFNSEKNTVYEELMSMFLKQKEIFESMKKLEFFLDNEDKLEEYGKLSEEYEKLDGYNIEYMIKQVMQGLNINHFSNEYIFNLSGGEKTRISLAKLLLEELDLLILDEPTNHLDIVSIEWLEEYLKKYKKAFILISHDRMFLDVVCKKIFEIENKKLYTYNGNFSDFVFQKELYLKGEIKRYEKESEKVKKLEEYIKRYKAGIKSKQARGREKILNRMERMEDPIFNPNRMKLKFDISNVSGDRVLEVKNIEKTFDSKKILNNISFDVFRGDKIGIIGKNGIGKSTLFKIIANKIKLESGIIKFGNRVKMSYYDQNLDNLFLENTILNEINTSINYSEEYLRSKAASFLFYKEDLDKKISNLSGGEKVRVTLLKMIEEKANFLLLDEPTNHLDIYSIEVLEDALIDYEGSFLLISHNRHFLDSVCNKMYYLKEDGIEEFNGNYTKYKESIANKKIKEEKNNNSYFEMKEINKKEAKKKKEILEIEEEIEKVENRLKILDREMNIAGIERNLDKIMEIQVEIEKLKIREEELLEKWTNIQ